MHTQAKQAAKEQNAHAVCMQADPACRLWSAVSLSQGTSWHAGCYMVPTGLAPASTLVRALSTAIMPPLATDTVCCSITSCSCRTQMDAVSLLHSW